MKLHSLRHILSDLAAMALLMGSMMATGCADSHVVVEDLGPDDVYNVEFRIKAGDVISSRATEELGTPDEGYIDIENLKILIFDENEKLYQVLYDNGTMDSETSFVHIGQGYYVLRTKLDPQRYNLISKFAVVVLANWSSSQNDSKLISDLKGHPIDDSEIGKLTIDDLGSMDFVLNPVVTSDPQPESWMPGNGRWIPMFGSRFTSLAGYNSSIFNEGNPMPIPDIHLVRAISKIEIINTTTPGNDVPVIESVALTRRNQRGFLMPEYDFNGFTSQVTSPTIPRNKEYDTSHPCPFYRNGNLYTVYLPEMNLPDADSRRAVCVNLNMNGVKYQRWIYLADYLADGTPNLTGPYNFDWDDVKRNYIYRYTLTLNFNLDQSIGVVVAPYNSVVLDPIFGLDEKPQTTD